MKKLESKVNIIPVIAKADTITKAELQKFKAKIMSELTSNGVQIYNFPTDDVTPLEHIILIRTSLSSFSLILPPYLRSSKYQYYSLWFEPTEV
jgi:septin family protein